MSNVVLRKLSAPQKLSNNSLLDTIKPLEYSEWLQNNIGIIPNQAHDQYNRYLNDWYDNKKESNDLSVSSNKIKEDYIALLKQLQIIFKDDPSFERISTIDFSSSLDIKTAIPFFAKKLKEIALYYVGQREALKKIKLQYNLTGSNNALNKILYENLLNSFTKKDQNVKISAQEIYNNVPELSSIMSDFVVEIEELFDAENYYDYDNKPDEKGIFDLVTDNPLLFVLRDYIKNEYGVLNTNEVPLSAFTNPLSIFSACEKDKLLNVQSQALLNRKYVGNDIFYLTGGFFDWDIKDVKLDMVPGNNFFYWFSGQQVRHIPEGTYLDVSLSAINYTNATGAPNVSASDIIFVSVGNIVTEGAWLLDTDKIVVNDTMSATMFDGKQFKFPYPGKGTSAEGGYWTGKNLSDLTEDDKRFFPSENTFQETGKKINEIYWAPSPSISAVQSILIQDTSLHSSGAFASQTFQQADKILVYPATFNQNTPVFAGDIEVAWLFDFAQTNIPILLDNNNIYYPLTAYQKESDLFFRYESGQAINLSALDIGNSFSGAVAGDNINNSDLLIKLNSICGPEIEVAWLKGYGLSAFSQNDSVRCNCDGNYLKYYTDWKFENGVTQPGLSFKCDPKGYVRFLWTGPNTNINDIQGFTGFNHDAACEYGKLSHTSSILDLNFLKSNDRGTYEKWKKCTCKAVNYSPMGHKGDTLLAYGYATDFIVEDSMFPEDFNKNFWKGFDDKTYQESSSLAWFKIPNLKEPDIGWGKGTWQTNENTAFTLETGKTYIYYRSDLNRCNFELPYFVINQCYSSCLIDGCNDLDCLPVWQKAKINIEGLYEDAGSISDMTLDSGNFYTYVHRRTSEYSKVILNYSGNRINTVSGSFVTLSAVDPLVTYEGATLINNAINFVMKVPLLSADPYWGASSCLYDEHTRNKQLSFGAVDFRSVADYLQIRQPAPSKMLLTNDAVIEYKLSECNTCFIWEQPLAFDISLAMRQWNKILFDNCIKSDILDYLHQRNCASACVDDVPICLSYCPENICGCAATCFSTKTGITATNIPSDMVFNTELSGIPVYVNYFARNPTTLSFTVTDITNGFPPDGGKWNPPVSSVFVKADEPWKNIINDFYSSVAFEASDANLFSAKELGLFVPSRLASGKYELHNTQKSIRFDTTDPLRLFRTDNYKDDVFNIDSIDSDWMKHKQGQNILGQINPNNHQTFHPYIDGYQHTKNNIFGLGITFDLLSPWNVEAKWNYSTDFPANITGLYPVNCGATSWYNSQYNLSGNIIEWQSDVYGNQYFLLNNSSTRLQSSSSFNDWFVKRTDGVLFQGNIIAEAIINKYKNIMF